MARYLLERLTEKYGVDIQYHCKPLGDTDWNGSGMHANFSTTYLREIGGKAYFEALMAAFKAAKDDHIAGYGPDNHMGLTGKHVTAAITDFTYGVADRGASIRVPALVKNDYKGYLEDRRPNSQGDPYQIASQILMTIDSVPKEALKAVAASRPAKGHARSLVSDTPAIGWRTNDRRRRCRDPRRGRLRPNFVSEKMHDEPVRHHNICGPRHRRAARGARFAETPVATATFKCQGGKSIEATFYASSVSLKLSDVRSLTVPQAMSASGARYANKDETFVFWNKGDTAFVTEGKDSKETYSGCATK